MCVHKVERSMVLPSHNGLIRLNYAGTFNVMSALFARMRWLFSGWRSQTPHSIIYLYQHNDSHDVRSSLYHYKEAIPGTYVTSCLDACFKVCLQCVEMNEDIHVCVNAIQDSYITLFSLPTQTLVVRCQCNVWYLY